MWICDSCEISNALKKNDNKLILMEKEIECLKRELSISKKLALEGLEITGLTPLEHKVDHSQYQDTISQQKPNGGESWIGDNNTITNLEGTGNSSRRSNRDRKNINKNTDNTKKIESKQIFDLHTVSAAIKDVQIHKKIKEVQPTNKNKYERKKIDRHCKRSVIVGQNLKNSAVRGIPKHVSLHVTRLEPNTKPEDLKALLISNFPEVIVELHNFNLNILNCTHLAKLPLKRTI
ncbi:hypothetical protein WA026_015840 [Henosepilachna vigintioctopunctata]|uniref:Uncharacterized protein n=1 Tax=Henosepilachna vigintioctopunctata TaxID=420089 RepID=A0AAW1UU12_9CUCU